MDEYKDMSGMDKVRLLYRKQKERLLKSEFTSNQARVAEELCEFYEQFDSIDSATEAIKSSPLYLKMGQAVVLDELEAREKAARHTRREDLAEIYRNQIDKVGADYSVAYDVSYEQEAQAVSGEYSELLHNFNEGLRKYYLAKAEPQVGGMEESTHINELRACLGAIANKGYSLETLSVHPYIKHSMGLPEQLVDEYVDNAEKIAGERMTSQEEGFAEEVEEAISDTLANADEIAKIAAENTEYFPGGYCVFIGPEEVGGEHRIVLDKDEDKDWRLK